MKPNWTKLAPIFLLCWIASDVLTATSWRGYIGPVLGFIYWISEELSAKALKRESERKDTVISGLQSQVEEQSKRTAQEERVRKTPPDIRVNIQRVAKNKFALSAITVNGIPFRYRWYMTLPNGEVVSPLPLGMESFVPTDKLRSITTAKEIKFRSLTVPDYVAVAFHWQSLHFDELPIPEQSGYSGSITQMVQLGKEEKEFALVPSTTEGPISTLSSEPQAHIIVTGERW